MEKVAVDGSVLAKTYVYGSVRCVDISGVSPSCVRAVSVRVRARCARTEYAGRLT